MLFNKKAGVGLKGIGSENAFEKKKFKKEGKLFVKLLRTKEVKS